MMRRLFFRNGNAGCYKSSLLIASIPHMSVYTGVFIARYTFSEAQAGKASCDRMSALMKRVLKDFVNSRHQLTNVQEIIEAFKVAQVLGLAPYGVELADVDIHRQLSKNKPDYRGISISTATSNFLRPQTKSTRCVIATSVREFD